MKIAGLIFVATVLLNAAPATPATSAGACKLPAGLYLRWESLEHQYSADVGSDYAGHRQEADRIVSEQKALAQTYHRVFSTVCQASRAGNLHAVTECCAATDDDPAARLMCNLAYYVGDRRKNPARFVRNFPESLTEIGTLWELDNMFAPGRDVPPECGPDGPAPYYVDELFRLVLQGNVPALERFVDLSRYADGSYADDLADQMKKLLVQKPDFVLAQWPTVRQFYGIKQIGIEFSDTERREAEQEYRDRCASKSQACTEVKEAISYRSPY
jgi:hypothetical protein